MFLTSLSVGICDPSLGQVTSNQSHVDGPWGLVFQPVPMDPRRMVSQSQGQRLVELVLESNSCEGLVGGGKNHRDSQGSSVTFVTLKGGWFSCDLFRAEVVTFIWGNPKGHLEEAGGC